jgi:two-component system, LytTR family, sensor kinase
VLAIGTRNTATETNIEWLRDSGVYSTLEFGFECAPKPAAMDSLLNDICVLVTMAFALTFVPGLRLRERSLLSMLDRGTALLVFLVLGSIEEISVSRSGWINERIVSVCAAGLVAGPWVGFLVSIFVTWLAVRVGGLPLTSIGLSMLCGGLAAGWLYQWRPKLAQRPLTGFCLTFAVSLLRGSLIFFNASGARAGPHTFGQIGMTPVVQGLGTALILAIIEQVRERDEQARAAASAEARALQARMNPHFLFNALNAVAALATVAPRQIPRAVGRLRQFLRASFDQHDRALVPLDEELAIVHAYLDIESLRFGNRLRVEEAIDPGLAEVLTPPFSLQPLVENAVQHGLQSSPTAGRLRLAVRLVGQSVEMSVSDDGKGVPSTKVKKIFFAARPRMHALELLRRRLQGLFGRAFCLEVCSEIGQGTIVTVRIPLPPSFKVAEGSMEPIMANPHRFAAE